MDLTAPTWLFSWLASINLWTALVVLSAVIGAGVFIRKKGWPWLTAFARAVVKTADVLVVLEGLPAFIARTDSTLEKHTKQLQNSHQTNLRDDVTAAVDASERVEKSVEGLHGRLDAVESDIKALHATTKDLAASDEELRAEIENTQGGPE